MKTKVIVVKILMWGPLPSDKKSGGVEEYIRNLSEKIIELGHDVDICTFGFGNKSKANVIKFPKFTKKYDIIHVHLALKSFGILSLLKRALTKEKLVFTIYIVHNPEIERERVFSDRIKSKIEFYLSKILAKSADALLTCSNYTKRRCLEEYGVAPLAVVFDGVDLSKFVHMDKQVARRKIIEKYNNIKENDKIILSLSRLTYTKGIDVLIRAFSKVLAHFPNTKLVIGGSGYYEKELKKLAEDIRISDKIIFTGFVPDDIIVHLYNSADIFCVPTRGKETITITTLEAFACSTPTVATLVGEMKYIKNDKICKLVKPEDIDELAKALCELLENINIRKKIGLRGLKYAKKYHDWDAIARAHIELYRSILDQ